MRESPACFSGSMALNPKIPKTCARNRRINVILAEILMAKGFFAAAMEVFAVRFKDLATPQTRFAIRVAVLFKACAAYIAVPRLMKKDLFVCLVGRISACCVLCGRKMEDDRQLVSRQVKFHEKQNRTRPNGTTWELGFPTTTRYRRNPRRTIPIINIDNFCTTGRQNEHLARGL